MNRPKEAGAANREEAKMMGITPVEFTWKPHDDDTCQVCDDDGKIGRRGCGTVGGRQRCDFNSLFFYDFFWVTTPTAPPPPLLWCCLSPLKLGLLFSPLFFPHSSQRSLWSFFLWFHAGGPILWMVGTRFCSFGRCIAERNLSESSSPLPRRSK